MTMLANLELGAPTMLIGGEQRPARSGHTYPNVDPATTAEIGTAADGDPDDMVEAIHAARMAFDRTEWSRDRLLRAHVLRQLADGLAAVADDFRVEFVRETGIPVALTAHLLDGPIHSLRHWADLAESFEYERALRAAEVMGVVHRRHLWREPFGVVGVITPWNSPFQLSLMKLGPVLAAGNTAILKPAPDTPWSGSVIGAVAAGSTDMPAGVLNVVTSSQNHVGDALTGHSEVDGITFTGSTVVGRHVAARAAATIKKVTLELGGKSARIVLDGVDVAEVASSAASAVCWRAGQGCALITRLIVPRSMQAELGEAVAAAMDAIPNGDPMDPSTIVGPLVNERQYERVLGYMDAGVAEGATLLRGGGRAEAHDIGYFVEPTAFCDVERGMRINQEEIFGPVLSILPYDSVDEAVDLANDTIFGLSSAVTGPSDEAALDVARRLRAGTCAVNGGSWFGIDTPFGGYKQSGLGRENGTWGFEEFLETKVVAVPDRA